MGLGGFPLTVLQKTVLLLRDFQLWFESLHIPDKHLDASATGTASELRQTRIDRQYFHLGWHLSGSPLCSLSLQSLIFSAKGKTTSRKKTTQQIFHSSHTELLGRQFESFFLGYSCFTESTYSSTSHRDFLYENLLNGQKPLHRYGYSY